MTQKKEQHSSLEVRLRSAGNDNRKLDIILEALPEIADTDPEQAVGLAGIAFQLCSLPQHTDRVVVILRHRGLCHFRLSHFDAATNDLQEAFDLAISLEQHTDAAELALSLGMVRNAAADPRGALQWNRVALDQSGRENNAAGEADALEALGDCYTGLGDYATAVEHYFSCLARREQIGEPNGVGVALSAIGRSYALTGDYDSAFDYFTRSLRAFRESGNRYYEVKSLINLGNIHLWRGELDTALEYSLKALTIYEALSDQSNVAATLVNMGHIYEKRGEIDRARECHHRALHALDEVADQHLHASILLNIGRLYQISGAYNESLFVLDQALRIAEETGERRLQYQIHEALANAYELLRHPAQALEHYRQFAHTRHELAGLEKQKAIAELQVRFDVEKAEREREIYRLKASQLEAAVESKQNELAAMALNLVQKNELLDTLRSHIKDLTTAQRSSDVGTMEKMLSDINRSHQDDAAWKTFEQQLDNLHHDFTRTLLERCPSLTPTELKICSLSRLNLSTKAIANLLYTSVRTIQVHRYNIRKKLRLGSETNLSSFLASI